MHTTKLSVCTCRKHLEKCDHKKTSTVACVTRLNRLLQQSPHLLRLHLVEQKQLRRGTLLLHKERLAERRNHVATKLQVWQPICCLRPSKITFGSRWLERTKATRRPKRRPSPKPWVQSKFGKWKSYILSRECDLIAFDMCKKRKKKNEKKNGGDRGWLNCIEKLNSKCLSENLFWICFDARSWRQIRTISFLYLDTSAL